MNIACGKCSHWKDGKHVTVYHASTTKVKECAKGKRVKKYTTR